MTDEKTADASPMAQPDSAEVVRSVSAPPAEDANQPSFRERVATLLADYERGMQSNAPRTVSELNEMRALLLGE